MNYFIIAGEASGDLHGSALIDALKEQDSEARFAFLGGDLMAQAAGHSPIIHYRDMAFMGFIEVIKHLPSILGFMKIAKQAMTGNRPDALILIDYPSFNLKMAKWAKQQGIKVFYFISPKVWVWKEWRVKDIKRWVDRMFCILPFEPRFYHRHNYEVDYVGNPTVKEMAHAIASMESRDEFIAAHNLDPSKPIIGLVPGSRKKEIRDNLPIMLAAARLHPSCQVVIAGAPSIDDEVYHLAVKHTRVPVLRDKTPQVMRYASVALVTSGTATLETALLGTPQVACYRMNGSKWVYRFYSKLLKGKYATLPNLIADAPVIPELLIHHCSVTNVDEHLTQLLVNSPERQAMLEGYEKVKELLTQQDCVTTTARLIIKHLTK